MIITIDGPAGAGKSSVARELARRLDCDFLDTGAMYRCIALLGLRNQVDWEQPEELFQTAQSAVIDVKEGRTYLNGECVEEAIRTQEVTQHTRYVADNPMIRELLVSLQRKCAGQIEQRGRSLVTEGRDQGTVVFPNTRYKIFLTASSQERANRRLKDLREKGDMTEYTVLLQQIEQRDARDREREFGALKEPENAFVLNTDGLDFEQVIQTILEWLKMEVP